MNILLISECDARALTETRRLLDQFAERRGERTWQTPITQEGLDTLRRLLRKTARKNTAVACHWIRGRDHSELLWIVGDARRFNVDGAVPTNTTARNVLRKESENDWHSLHAIHLLSALSALLHDLGKACAAFQDRLLKESFEKNLIRHEWISMRLFQAFVGADDDAAWLQRLIAHAESDDKACLGEWLDKDRLLLDGIDSISAERNPLACLPPIARAVGWLVLTHHRLPTLPVEDGKGDYKWFGAKPAHLDGAQLDRLLGDIDARWNEPRRLESRSDAEPYWRFPEGLPVTTPTWRKNAARIARRLLEYAGKPEATHWLADAYVMHVSRLSLMLADHHYSSLTRQSDRLSHSADYPLHANTRKEGGRTVLNQKLDEHLLGVETHARVVTHALPGFEQHLPRLARHKGLRRRSDSDAYRWQDRATDVASAMRSAAQANGAFIVNMASTGCGKTLANARVMNALADPLKGMRCAFAMGLRTLTLQTGRAFRDLLKLSDDELAVQVGGVASRELFDYHEKQAERSGSASKQPLLPEDEGHVLFEGNEAHPLLQRLTGDTQVRSLLAAPILVCTIDHLTPATESLRGGRQIAPMLRLMSGDLVLDEPDDFDLGDLPALTRLVHWAGLLGSRLLLSSATLPPALVEGLFLAYCSGREVFQRNRGERPGEAPAIACAWFDEFQQSRCDCLDAEVFRDAHLAFARKRHARLGSQPVRRRSELLPLELSDQVQADRRSGFALRIRDAALRLHADHHSLDPRTGKRVSFGLVRMANIEPLFEVALALYRHGFPEGVRAHLCVYHSQFPLLIRSEIERHLDASLDRRVDNAVFDLPHVRRELDAHPEHDHLFIVLGSPVTEVGRDHDYDWGVVEPSSMRSLIQLAGRIRRHRMGPVVKPNLLVFDRNLRSFEKPGEAAFRHPGFEDNGIFKLTTHRLTHLLDAQEGEVIDARPRILPRAEEELRPRERLVDLEHVRLAQRMLPKDDIPDARNLARGKKPKPAINAASFWRQPEAGLTGLLQQRQPFREDPRPRIELVFLPDDDESLCLHRVAEGEKRWQSLFVPVEGKCERMPDHFVHGERIAPWCGVDLMAALTAYAAAFDRPLDECARRFTVVQVPDATQGWRYHPTLGFVPKG